ncbi:hypothetical protein D3C81_09720 [compost metagenome]
MLTCTVCAEDMHCKDTFCGGLAIQPLSPKDFIKFSNVCRKHIDDLETILGESVIKSDLTAIELFNKGYAANTYSTDNIEETRQKWFTTYVVEKVKNAGDKKILLIGMYTEVGGNFNIIPIDEKQEGEIKKFIDSLGDIDYCTNNVNSIFDL